MPIDWSQIIARKPDPSFTENVSPSKREPINWSQIGQAPINNLNADDFKSRLKRIGSGDYENGRCVTCGEKSPSDPPPMKCWSCLCVEKASQAPSSKSESPIETSMLLALRRAFPKSTLILQQIPLCGGKYRADLIVILPPNGLVVVECDGHDFHEKTKQQATRDKKRDRDIQIEGWRVLRFSGSEIYANADRCAQDVLALLRLK